MTRPLISIVIPTLDQAPFLPATLESLRAQRYEPLELFVQDGGSTDGTIEILEASGIPFVSQSDRGQADAINRGLRRARGEILAYLNSDDLLLPGALDAVAEAFADPKVRFVYGRAIYVDEAGRTVGPYLTRPWDPERLADLCYIAQPAAFWRRSLWRDVGEFDETLHHTMDYDYWLRVAERVAPHEVVHLDRELAAARLHAGAKTMAGWDRALEEILDLVRRRRGYVSLWWLVAKWDQKRDGRNQALAPHAVPWSAYPPAVLEFLKRNPPRLWARGLRGAPRGLLRRLSRRGP